MPHSFSSTGLPSLAKLQLRSKTALALHVADQIVALHLRRSSSRATSPDSRSCCGSWPASLRPPSWSSSLIQGSCLDVLAQRLLKRRHQLVHACPWPRAGSSASPSPGPRLRPARGRSCWCTASSAASAPSGPASVLPKKSKFSSKKALGRSWRLAVQHMPAQIALPRVDRLALQSARSAP